MALFIISAQPTHHVDGGSLSVCMRVSDACQMRFGKNPISMRVSVGLGWQKCHPQLLHELQIRLTFVASKPTWDHVSVFLSFCKHQHPYKNQHATAVIFRRVWKVPKWNLEICTFYTCYFSVGNIEALEEALSFVSFSHATTLPCCVCC